MGGVAWTEEEDHLLKKCIQQYGEGKWHRVPLLAGKLDFGLFLFEFAGCVLLRILLWTFAFIRIKRCIYIEYDYNLNGNLVPKIDLFFK
jgi:hypothetical protein